MTDYEIVVGLEIHAELNTRSKIFCKCRSVFGAEENSKICPHCAGIPGALPTINKEAILLAARAGLAFNCEIQNYSAFDRKNYYYPDLPKAYQITQFYYPIALGGYVTVGKEKFPLERIHIEEDAGKLTHKKDENISLADYNRCGVPLIEIVSKPCLYSAKAAENFVKEVARTLKYIDVCDCKMQEGSLRCDVNISLKPKGTIDLGKRTEIKNLNSFRAIRHAIEKEAERQKRIYDSGEDVLMQTLHFDDISGALTVLRTKEGEDDYRYFPEPDLPAIFLSNEDIKNIKDRLPEMPIKRVAAMTEKYNLQNRDAEIIASEKEVADLFDAAAKQTENIKTLTSLLVNELPRIKKENPTENSKLSALSVGRICNMVKSGLISNGSAKTLFYELYVSGGDPDDIAKKLDMFISYNEEAVISTVKEVLAQNPKAVSEYKSGSEKVFGFLMGKVAKKSGRASSPAKIKDILKKELEK